jgi:hypothetical protein
VNPQAPVYLPWGSILLINGLGVAAVAYFGQYTFPERLMLGAFAASLAVYGLVQLARGIMARRENTAGTVADGPPPAPDSSPNTQ